MTGLLTGLAGMIEASRLMTGQPTSGQGYELTVGDEYFMSGQYLALDSHITIQPFEVAVIKTPAHPHHSAAAQPAPTMFRIGTR